MQMSREIYGAKTDLRPLDSIGFHLLEEGGEEAKAIRTLTQFRGVCDNSMSGVSEGFLRDICTLKTLVNFHRKLTEEVLKYSRCSTELEMRKKKLPLSSDKSPVVLKWKIVSAKLEMVAELCDTFSWFCTVLLKCGDIAEKLGLKDKEKAKWNIEECIGEIYKSKGPDVPLRCYACAKSRCECTNFAKLY